MNILCTLPPCTHQDVSNSSYIKDYFSNPPIANTEENVVPPTTPNPQQEIPSSPEPTKETFMGRLKSFGAKKLTPKLDKGGGGDDVTSPPANGTTEKEDDRPPEEDTNNNNGTNGTAASAAKEKPYLFSDVLSTVRKTYETALNKGESSSSDQASLSSISRIPVLEDGKLRSALTPSGMDDTPLIRPSPDTIIIIAEPRFSVDGSMDLYRGTVASVGKDVDILESIAPGWLGELLLLDKLPKKDIVKISFVLKPHLMSALPDMLAGYQLPENFA
jgi:WD repeat-containing protein 48